MEDIVLIDMDLDYVAGNNSESVEKLNSEGFDLDTLFYTCKDLFQLLEDVKLTES